MADPVLKGAAQAAEARLRLLVDAGAVLSAALDVEDGLTRLASLLGADLGDYAVTYLLDGERVRRVGAGHGEAVPSEVIEALLALPAPGLESQGAGRVMSTGEPVLAPRITRDLLVQAAQNPEHLRILLRLNPTSSIVVPLRARGQTLGAISISTVVGGRPPFTRHDLEFAMELASRVALLTDNARLYVEAQAEVERRREADDAVRKRYEQLRILYQMAEAVSRAGAAEEVFDQALDALAMSLDADRGSILLYDDEGILRFRAWRGLSDGYRAAVEGHSPWSPDTEDPAPIVIPDVADSELDVGLRDVILGEGIRALAFFPLAFGTGLLGKFMVYFDRPHALSAPDVELARAVARSISFAISRVKGEERLRTALDAAEEASRVKSQFLAVMSHELRTPLNAILGYADLLETGIDGPLTPSQAARITRIQASGRLLVELIDEVLIYARLEAGKEELRLAEVDLEPLIRETCAIVEPLCAAKGLDLRVGSPDAPVRIRTDLGKLRQIVLNLLSNAVKFTDAGGVDVSIERRNGVARVAVSDTGPGIDPADRERIFEPFTQGDSSATRTQGGTGLGLAVSRRLATLLGGDLAVDSEPGRGSRFTVSLPAEI